MFKEPYDVVCHEGRCFVSDHSNHCIRMITPDGSVKTLAGCPGQKGYADGTGTEALFRNPRGMFAFKVPNLLFAAFN